MTKSEIQAKLIEVHNEFITQFDLVSANKFEENSNNKWSPSEELDHIRRSVAPLAALKKAPKFAVKTMYGTGNGVSLSYEGLVKKYEDALAQGGSASGKFIPKKLDLDSKEKIIDGINSAIADAVKGLDKYSEKNLDKILLPHPLIGKLTMREMMYFTIFHAQAHTASVAKKINS